MLTNKQRSYLSSLANGIPDIVFIGKNGINEEIIKQVRNNLKARELIKVKVQQNSPITAREAADRLAEIIKCDVVRTIGNKFILYKKNLEKKENLIPSKTTNKRKRIHHKVNPHKKKITSSKKAKYSKDNKFSRRKKY